MLLSEAIRATGMTPPEQIPAGRWVRFPGVGKGRANKSGWCRVVSPTLAIFGDWSSDVRVTWRDDSHRDDVASERLLEQAHRREREFRAGQERRQARASQEAIALIKEATLETHPYLIRKGFPDERGLVHEGTLLVPMWDVRDYRRLLGVQRIEEDGEKRFLPGARARGAIYRLGMAHAFRVLLCEGYATGLTLRAAITRLSGSAAVIVCFSATNLQFVSEQFPGALACADNDLSHTGERVARATGLRWAMPDVAGEDFNDVQLRCGLHAVTDRLRQAFQK